MQNETSTNTPMPQPDVWQSNLSALRSRYPDLAEETARYQTTVRLFPSQTGILTGELTWSDTSILLHSRYDPAREAEREAESLVGEGGVVGIMLGMGLGYTVRELVQRRRDRFYDLLVIERDLGIFRAALEAVPLAAALRDHRVQFVVGEKINQVIETTRRLLPSIMTSRLQTILHRPSHSLYQDYYDQVVKEIRHLVELTTAEFQLMLRSGLQLQENLWRNLPQMIGQPGVAKVENVFAGVPAFVVAAGPSLGKNITQLSNVGDSGVILCVDTAYRLLKNQGIVPHFVVSTDPSPLNELHFRGLSFGTEPVLAFDPEVYHTIPSMVPWRRLVINLDKCATTRWFEEQLGPWGCLEKGGSVANTAFTLARQMGCDPIVLVGLDLAYDPRGGASHAQGTALARPIETPEPGATTIKMGPHQATGKPLVESAVWVPGAMGGEVPSSPIMVLYIRKFEQEIARTKRHVIDATEGGALIRGTQVRQLADTISSLCTGNHGVRSRLSAVLTPSRRVELDRVHGLIDQVAGDLGDASHLAQKGLAITAKLQSRLAKGAEIRRDPLWIQMEEIFSQIYGRPLVRVGVEQALFPAIYQFSLKEPEHAVGERFEKYRKFFVQAVVMCERFSGLLDELFAR